MQKYEVPRGLTARHLRKSRIQIEAFLLSNFRVFRQVKKPPNVKRNENRIVCMTGRNQRLRRFPQQRRQVKVPAPMPPLLLRKSFWNDRSRQQCCLYRYVRSPADQTRGLKLPGQRRMTANQLLDGTVAKAVTCNAAQQTD